MAEYPREMEAWEQRRQWLLKDFITTSKAATESLQGMMKIGNGDMTSPVVTHWCKGSCCASEEESLYKFLSHAVHFFGKGFDTPLLYRMKHYGPASSFVTVGCALFNLLPRVLLEMEESASARHNDEAAFIDSLLSDSRGSLQEADFQHMLADALDADQNYAAQNGARKKMITAEIRKPEFPQSALLIDSLIQPMEVGVNKLFRHTKVLHDLTYLGSGHPKRETLEAEARRIFLDVVSGSFCDMLTAKYLRYLDNGLEQLVQMGLEPVQKHLDTIFIMVIVVISDLFRRFKLDFLHPPFTPQ